MGGTAAVMEDLGWAGLAAVVDGKFWQCGEVPQDTGASGGGRSVADSGGTWDGVGSRIGGEPTGQGRGRRLRGRQAGEGRDKASGWSSNNAIGRPRIL